MRWKHIQPSDEFHFEYHMKTISVDGFDPAGQRVTTDAPAVLISGSANKDHMTMYGAFREMQAEMYDQRGCSTVNGEEVCGAVAKADKIFWSRWNAPADQDGSVPIGPFNFEIPPQVQLVFKKTLGRDMSKPEFIKYMRGLMHLAYELESSTNVE